jgi:hypothetical protein
MEERHMAKETAIDEVSILKFFETGPVEKAEVLYNIVSAKMRERLSGRATDGGEPAEPGPARRRQARSGAEAPREDGSPPPKA